MVVAERGEKTATGFTPVAGRRALHFSSTIPLYVPFEKHSLFTRAIHFDRQLRTLFRGKPVSLLSLNPPTSFLREFPAPFAADWSAHLSTAAKKRERGRGRESVKQLQNDAFYRNAEFIDTSWSSGQREAAV